MNPRRRPILFALGGSVVGATCASLVFLGLQPGRDDVGTAVTQAVGPTSSPVGQSVVFEASDTFASRVYTASNTAKLPGMDWMDADAFGHSGPSLGTSTPAANGTLLFGPTPSQTVLGAPQDEIVDEPDTFAVGEGPEENLAEADEAPSLAPGDTVEITLTIDRGATLMGLLLDQEVPRTTAVAAVEALKKAFDPRSLRAGQEMSLTFRVADDSALLFDKLSFEPSIGVTVSLVTAEDGSFVAEKQAMPLVRYVVRHDGVIRSSLSEAAIAAGASPKVLADMIRVFSYDVDFQRDIRQDDTFSLFYEQLDTEDGRTAKTGDLLFASLTLSGKTYNLYRYELGDGTVDYYNEKGEGVRKALLRTPINGARLSSNFGKRRHPILGYTRMHKGVDFAAPSGTPIYAAGDGVVAKAEFGRGYGNHVRLRHDSEFQTLYGHMRSIASGIRPGTRVKQGQVIGYVGSTGMSTGPHLHYEIIRNGAHVNPASTRFAASKNLTGNALAQFQKERTRIQTAFQTTPTGTKLASAD